VTAGELTRADVPADAGHTTVEGAATDDAVIVDTEHAPATWHPEVLEGPLSRRALRRVDEALRLADQSTGLTFSVYIGDLDEPAREHAERLHAQIVDPDNVVLVAVSPNQRILEIVTGASARRRILDRDSKLAALSMAAAFSGGDLGGGIVAGIAQLARHTGRS
jgi:Domain of unknown function (DUF5130)